VDIRGQRIFEITSEIETYRFFKRSVVALAAHCPAALNYLIQFSKSSKPKALVVSVVRQPPTYPENKKEHPPRT